MEDVTPSVAIVNYGLGNLFSVRQACAHAGMEPAITSSPDEILSARAVVIPGVGSCGDAIDSLQRLVLVPVLREVVAAGTPLIGICLGAQLLLEESEEFGRHEGLGVIPGRVVSLRGSLGSGDSLKVPHVGWNRVHRLPRAGDGQPWRGTLLEDQQDGAFMYFVHSFILQPRDEEVIIAASHYGELEFCSGMAWRNVTALQFHPERSGLPGLRIYQRLADRIRETAVSQES